MRMKFLGTFQPLPRIQCLAMAVDEIDGPAVAVPTFGRHRGNMIRCQLWQIETRALPHEEIPRQARAQVAGVSVCLAIEQRLADAQTCIGCQCLIGGPVGPFFPRRVRLPPPELVWRRMAKAKEPLHRVGPRAQFAGVRIGRQGSLGQRDHRVLHVEDLDPVSGSVTVRLAVVEDDVGDIPHLLLPSARGRHLARKQAVVADADPHPGARHVHFTGL
mmetsp:Transcript_32900/g.99372  ORF Transcript_32900/g.99372 Transcript_32900/m.99372 type:complete len:217 (-) Transcript_32900:5109-5759(-)